MTELLTAAQMRAIEQAAIESGDVTGLELMERAGQGVVEAIFEEWPELSLGEAGREGSPSRSPEYLDKEEVLRAVVLCGPGNNGGDGFVVARLLKERGWGVEVFLYGDAGKLPLDAKVNYERWGQLGGVAAMEDHVFDCWPDENSGVDLIVDALFGTGLARPFLEFSHLSMTLNTCSSFSRTRNLSPRVVAVDLPSGMCADSGFWFGDDQPNDFAGLANLTVTFHSAKLGHHLNDGPGSCGKLKIVDIGLSHSNEPGSLSRKTLISHAGLETERGLGRHIVRRMMSSELSSYLSKLHSQHKYSHGHALVLSGGHGNTGAARLAARGALRIGAGLVTVGSPRSAMFENAANLTAIMLRQIDGALGLAELLEDARFNALCLGPGLGLRADTQALVLTVLKANRPTVLDADALTRFSAKPEVLFDVLHKDCVITPHGGEFTRLFPDIAEKLAAPATSGPAYSKIDATREAARRAGCVVVFKGPDTVIATPDGHCSINSAQYERAAPWLATAGSGDVLAGFITGLMARGFNPKQAAETAAWLHVECARKFGPGLIAEDLADQLPSVFRDLSL